MTRLTCTAVAGALALLAACGNDHDHDHDHDHGGGSAHAHEPRHGGTVVELGDHEGFLEFAHDRAAGTLEIWLYAGDEMEAAEADAAPVLNLMTAKGRRQVEGAGAGAHWTFTDAALKSDAIETARLRLALAGKSYTPPLELVPGKGGD